MKKLIIALVVCLLLISTSCKFGKATTPVNTKKPPTTDELQTQIWDLSAQIGAYTVIINGLGTKGDGLATPAPEITTTTPAIPAADGTDAVDIDAMSANVDKLTTQVRILQENVMQLQQNMKTNATNIGTTSMKINGLDVTLLTNGIEVGTIGVTPSDSTGAGSGKSTATTPGSAQFAIKITNLSKNAISNLDITGTITSMDNITLNSAVGYPQVTEAGGVAAIAFSNTGENIITFEAYGSAKGNLTIPAGGSVTIRPRLTYVAAATKVIPATSFILAINAITYDGGNAQ